jgi:NADP-dependent 3-hydroxy acid dehydrogenase YdfG
MSQQAPSKVVLVTGASSGIGQAIATQLAASGHRVVLGARRTERLQALTSSLQNQGLKASFQALDVTRLEDVQQFVTFAERTYGPVDVLVNNAGVMPLSPLNSLKIKEWERMIDVNIRGVLYGIAAVLPGMETRGSGQIINVSSIGGHIVFPTSAVYCGTKFAVRAISDGLRQETDKIRVTVISPGVVESELADSISHESTRAAIQEFRRIAIKADAIARAVAYAIEQPNDVDVSEVIVRPTASPH